jgi:hypothetical protein
MSDKQMICPDAHDIIKLKYMFDDRIPAKGKSGWVLIRDAKTLIDKWHHELKNKVKIQRMVPLEDVRAFVKNLNIPEDDTWPDDVRAEWLKKLEDKFRE